MTKHLVDLRILLLIGIITFFTNSCEKDDGHHQILTIESQIHNKINDYRLAHGRSTLVFQPILFKEARTHSSKMANGVIDVGYDGLDAVFNDLRNKLGATDGGAVVEVTVQTVADSIVNLIISNASKEEIVFGNFTQAGVGFASDKDKLNYVTILFLNIP